MPVVPITDLNQEGLAPYTALTERQARADGILIAESEMVIRMALGCGLTPLSFLMEARHARGKAASLIADFPGIPVYTGDEEILKALTGYSLTRGILCALRRPAPRPWRSLMSGSRFVLLCG